MQKKNKMQIAAAGTILLAAAVFATTSTDLNLASVISSTNSQIQECIQNLPQGNTLSDYEISTERINTTDSKKDYILKGTTNKLCGTTGCIYRICISDGQTFKLLPFAYAAETLVIKRTITSNMHDIQLRGKSTANFQWNGDMYTILQ